MEHSYVTRVQAGPSHGDGLNDLSNSHAKLFLAFKNDAQRQRRITPDGAIDEEHVDDPKHWFANWTRSGAKASPTILKSIVSGFQHVRAGPRSAGATSGLAGRRRTGGEAKGGGHATLRRGNASRSRRSVSEISAATHRPLSTRLRFDRRRPPALGQAAQPARRLPAPSGALLTRVPHYDIFDHILIQLYH